MLPGAVAGDAGAAPLEITEIKAEGFCVRLPGRWRQRRTGDLLELVEDGGGHRISIRAKNLPAPLADGALPALVDRLLDELRRSAVNAAEEHLDWENPPALAGPDFLERRSVGGASGRPLRVALLARASSARVVSATLVYRHTRGAELAPAADFGALASVVFDQIGRGAAS